jgi:glucosamine-6-phosphate deaminase
VSPLLRTSIAYTVYPTAQAAAQALADELAERLRQRPQLVLGLPTGNTPLGLYRELIERQRRGSLSFARASCFHLDEYLGLSLEDPRSFAAWMQQQFLQQVDFAPERIHRLRSALDPHQVDHEAQGYEAQIQAAGGIDCMLLGIGRNGHIAFNEPGSARNSRTRAVQLESITLQDAASSFGGLERVPRQAITMGVATILESRTIRVLAFGTNKAAIVRQALCSAAHAAVPATWLAGHPDVHFLLDPASAAELPG